MLNMLTAQNGKFEVGAFLHKVDCELGKVQVDLKIKASDGNTEFYLANQNYRLSFNRSALRPGSVSLESELDISGLIQTPENFSSGYFVTADEWVSIGRIGLDIANANECFTIQFHTQDAFPPTYISEVLDPTTHVPIGGLYVDLEACLSDYCEEDEPEELPVSVEQFADYQRNIQVLLTAVHSELTVQYTLQGLTDMTHITIADMQGRVWQQHQKQLTGQNTFKFDVSHLPQGIYLVNTLIDGQWIPRKFVKI